MSIYWKLCNIPEFANLPEAERIAIRRACYGAAFRHWQTWVSMLVCAICIGAGWYASLLWSRAFVLDSLLMWLSIVLIGGLGGSLGVLIYQQTVIAVLRPTSAPTEHSSRCSEEYECDISHALPSQLNAL